MSNDEEPVLKGDVHSIRVQTKISGLLDRLLLYHFYSKNFIIRKFNQFYGTHTQIIIR